MPENWLTSEEPIRKVLSELQRRFRIAGRGSVARVERDLGLSSGYFKDQRRPERRRFDLRILFRALEALDIDPAEFFSSVLGNADPLMVFLAEGAALRRRRKRIPRILALEAEREERGDVSRDEQSEELEALDRLRLDDPELVIRRARRMMPKIADSLVAPLLGVYASACRVAGKSNEAMAVLFRALVLAQEEADPEVVADLMLRAGYVTASRGQAEMALALAERSTLVSTRSGDRVGIGRALHDQGTWHYHLGHPRRALASMRSAVSYLEQGADSSPGRGAARSRFSCLMTLGVMHRGQGELDIAEDYLRQAREHPREVVGEQLYGKLVALQASIAREAGRYLRAEELYRESLEIFRPIAPYDTALCGLELARIQLRCGNTADAYVTAKGLMPLVEPLEKNPAASAALTELLRVALTGHGLTEALLQQVAIDLQEEQKQTPRG